MIQDFLNYASDGKVTERPSVKITTPRGTVTLDSFKTEVVNNMKVHTYEPPIVVVEKYSDRSFALFGDGTKLLKDDLPNYGGTFNRFLKFEGKPRPGWIFSIKRREQIRKRFEL